MPACEKDQTRQDSTWLPCGIPSVIHAFFLNRRMDSQWGSCVYGIACGQLSWLEAQNFRRSPTAYRRQYRRHNYRIFSSPTYASKGREGKSWVRTRLRRSIMSSIVLAHILSVSHMATRSIQIKHIYTYIYVVYVYTCYIYIQIMYIH